MSLNSWLMFFAVASGEATLNLAVWSLVEVSKACSGLTGV